MIVLIADRLFGVWGIFTLKIPCIVTSSQVQYIHTAAIASLIVIKGNLLMNSHGAVKLADFGIARALEHSQAMSNTSCGTFRYMSLER